MVVSGAVPEYVAARPWTKFYSEGVSHDIEIPGKPFYELFEEACEKFAQRTSIIFLDTSISYSRLRELVHRFASGLRSMGVGQGDKVAIYLPNCPQFVISYLGAQEAGAVTTTMNPLYTSAEVQHQLKDSDAETIVCLDILFKNVEPVKENTSLRRTIVTNIADFLPPLKRRLGILLKKVPTARVPRGGNTVNFMDVLSSSEPVKPEVTLDIENDVAALPYTGGTTGVSKGVMQTHRNLVATERACYTFIARDLKDGAETYVALLPFYHVYGQIVIMGGGLSHGQTLLVFPRLDLKQLLNGIQKHRATVFFGVPTLYNAIINYPKIKEVDLTSLKLCLCGADTLHSETAKRFEELTGLKICEGYGQTEYTVASHVNPLNRVKLGSFGVPLPSTFAAIMDAEGTRLLPPGEVGEVVLSGPMMTLGYWKKPEETSRTFIEVSGMKWLRTGDIGKMDEEGYFYFVERKRDLIKYKGYSVFPAEVEGVLYQHPTVKEATVVGIPDPIVGETIKAAVVLKEGQRGKTSQEELLAWCKERLAPYKIPKEIRFVDEIPKTMIGKVLRRRVRESLQN